MFYNARWYDPALGRFAQADTIIPGAGNPQAWDRYAYAYNNPLYYTDPSGHAAECGIYAGTSCGGVGPLQPTLVRDKNGITISRHMNMPREDVINGVNTTWEVTTTVYSIIFEPVDWFVSGTNCLQGECSPWMLAGLLPLIPSNAGSHVDDIIDAGRAVDAGKGFTSFKRLKKFLGDAGEDKHWHHIVEQIQIKKSGFSPQQIHNVENAVAVDAATHSRISGFYNSNIAGPGTQRVRDWLAGQSFEAQYKFGINVLEDYGVIP